METRAVGKACRAQYPAIRKLMNQGKYLATSTGKEMPLRLPPPTRILLTPPQVRPRERRVKKYLQFL